MKTHLAIAVLVLSSACSPAEEGASEVDPSTQDTQAVDQPAATEPVSDLAEDGPKRIAVTGTVDEIVLDGEEPMVVVSGEDGSKYLAVTASGQIDAILESTQGVGSQISLDCGVSNLPPEDGYVWVEECELA